MKAKQTPVAAATSASAPRSLKDAGYQAAQIGEGRAAIARYVLDKCPEFLDACPKEVKEELFAGFQLRAYELWGDSAYRQGEMGGLVPDATGAPGNIVLNVNVAMAYTGQAFGKLKEENPDLHGLIKALREKFSKYASNCMADLRTACKRIVNESSPRERSANKAFTEALRDALTAFGARAKTAQGRGDTTADPVKFRMAVEAFWRTYS